MLIEKTDYLHFQIEYFLFALYNQIVAGFGVNCEWLTQDQLFIEANQKYISRDYTIEADASSASYFFAMAAITKGQITLAPFSPKSLQGDLGFLQILKNMGCQIKWGINEVTLIGKELHAVEVDMKDGPKNSFV